MHDRSLNWQAALFEAPRGGLVLILATSLRGCHWTVVACLPDDARDFEGSAGVSVALGLPPRRWAATPTRLRPPLWKFWLWPDWRRQVAEAKAVLRGAGAPAPEAVGGFG